MMRERDEIAKIVEQELAGILFQSVKLAEIEGVTDFKGGVLLMLRVIQKRKEDRDSSEQ
jgi:hypothetical protein